MAERREGCRLSRGRRPANRLSRSFLVFSQPLSLKGREPQQPCRSVCVVFTSGTEAGALRAALSEEADAAPCPSSLRCPCAQRRGERLCF